VEENAKLGGTIFSAAAEIEAAGGKATGSTMRYPFEDQVQNVIDKAVERFGGMMYSLTMHRHFTDRYGTNRTKRF